MHYNNIDRVYVECRTNIHISNHKKCVMCVYCKNRSFECVVVVVVDDDVVVVLIFD